LRAERYSHELGHFASGTESRRELAYSLAGETRRPAAGKYTTATANAAEAQFVLEAGERGEAPTPSETYYEAREAVASVGYGVSVEEIDSAWEKSLTGEEMTEAEELAYEELVSKMIDLTLGTEESVRRMARRSPKLAQQLLDRVSDTVDLFRGTNADRAQTKKLR
jgi:hypothetical protein